MSRIYVIPPNEGTGSTFLISPTTGLIETPEYFEKEEEVKENDSVNQSASSQPLTDEQYDALTESKKMVRGYNVKSLLQHQISTSSSVRVESSSLNGSFKVKKGKHTCNGSSYYTEMEVII